MITPMEMRTKLLALLCACGACACGCAPRKTPAKPVVNFVAVVHPVIPASTTNGVEPAPAVEAGALPEPPPIMPSRPQPAKPHIATATAQEPSGVEKHTEPTIAPEVTTQEMTEARAEAQHSLDVAEKNLNMTQGKKLNATQEDLASKVRGFGDNAREAMRSGDWARAKSLAKKAEVLSAQLAGSL
jgi:hypothetical protein